MRSTHFYSQMLLQSLCNKYLILQLEYFPLLLIIYLFYSLFFANGLSLIDIYSTGKDFDITCIFDDLTNISCVEQ